VLRIIIICIHFRYAHKIKINGIRAICSLLFLMHVQDEVRVQRIGSRACFLEEKIYHIPKQPLMAVEKKYDRT
jgi:hypothetical protein